MELVALLRVLWRFRIAVAVGAIVAIGVGLMLTRGATSRFGVASMRVMLDTPQSQTVDANPTGAATLEWRAGLLADLMGSDALRLRIARQMGIPADSLVVTAPYLSVPVVPVPLPRHALDVAAVIPQPYQLAIQAASWLPIIRIDARAPSRAAGLATRHRRRAGAEGGGVRDRGHARCAAVRRRGRRSGSSQGDRRRPAAEDRGGRRHRRVRPLVRVHHTHGRRLARSPHVVPDGNGQRRLAVTDGRLVLALAVPATGAGILVGQRARRVRRVARRAVRLICTDPGAVGPGLVVRDRVLDRAQPSKRLLVLH